LRIFESVPNVSEGHDADVVDACARAIEAAGPRLAHRTSDPVHNRSVFTYFGTYDHTLQAALALAAVTTERIDLRVRRGAHPRIGALDVLPFVPFGDATETEAIKLAHDVAQQIWERLRVPSFFYGAAAMRPERTLLANVRLGEFESLGTRSDRPDVGDVPHRSAGAIAIGVRAPLVAFNVVLATGDLTLARTIARSLRERGGGLRTLRALGIALDDAHVQVSCNLTDYAATPLHRVVGLVRTLAAAAGVAVARTEVIGLVPRRALEDVVSHAFGSEVRSLGAQNSET
jgi:glutamate formiminotransferase